jgi:hypothetical protein
MLFASLQDVPCTMRGQGQSQRSAAEAVARHRSPFVLYPRMPRILFLTLLRTAKHPAFEFSFGLEPIVQLSARLFAAFEIDLVCATSDFFVTP